MEITLNQVKALRERTGAGVVESQQTLVEAKGDLDAAVTLLRKRGQAKAEKKQSRKAQEGVIGSYIHSNQRVAALVELFCETDFVSRTEKFKELAHEVAMQVAATNPAYLKPEDVPTEVLAHEREIAGADSQGKPPAIVEKIIAGKLERFYREHCLIKQPLIRDESVSVEQLVTDAVTKFGENIQIGQFIRFQL